MKTLEEQRAIYAASTELDENGNKIYAKPEVNVVKETSKEEIEQIKEFQKQKNQEGKEQNKRNLEKLKSFFKIKKNYSSVFSNRYKLQH